MESVRRPEECTSASTARKLDCRWICSGVVADRLPAGDTIGGEDAVSHSEADDVAQNLLSSGIAVLHTILYPS